MRQDPLTIPLRASGDARARRGEPVSFGVPMPRGRAHASACFVLQQGDEAGAVQSEILDRWSDGSTRWLLVHGRLPGHLGQLALRQAECVPESPPARVQGDTSQLRLEPGPIVVTLACGQDFPIRGVTDATGTVLAESATLHLTSAGGARWSCDWHRLVVERAGPMRLEVRAEGEARSGRRRLRLQAHFVAHAGLPTLSMRLVLTNPAGAAHPDGRWELGDPASLLLSEVAVSWRRPSASGECRVVIDPGDGAPLVTISPPCEIFQASSGGRWWNGRVHVTRRGRVELDFRGYALRAKGVELGGDRASPVVSVGDGAGAWHVASPYFWQVAPKAIRVDEDGRVHCGLFPRQARSPQELQPGERTSWECTVAFGADPVAATPLDWVRTPTIVSVDPPWVQASGAIPGLMAAHPEVHPAYEALVVQAIEGDDTFAAKRERIDEYGWRNFGDLHADHEAVQHDGSEPFVSHWNNHYDAASGGLIQYLRTADPRWWHLALELARHTADVDIYRTTEDKSAYAGGMFWHTAHHVDAGLSSHRTYPSHGRTSGGGPSSGQLYNGGLLLAWFLTGDTRFREAVVDLAQYVITAEDGTRTIFRWLDRSATGHMSHSGPGYHGPGRAGANAIQVVLNGHRLTGDARYLQAAETLLRRCVHPDDDITGRGLLDAERRWFYTMFLQVIAAWLDDLDERGRHDDLYAYARGSLVAYARWMVERERFTLDHPEGLEYPTETWAAQELRKADVLARAARHVNGAERLRMLARADEFFAYAVRTLGASGTRSFCRPVVLCMTNGWAHAWHLQVVPTSPLPVALPPRNFGTPVPFVAQRTRAIMRAKRLLVLLAAIGAGLVLLALIIVGL